MPLRSRVRQDRNLTLGGGGATVCFPDRMTGETGLHVFWTLRQMHVLKPDVLETAPAGDDPIIEGDARIPVSQLSHLKT